MSTKRLVAVIALAALAWAAPTSAEDLARGAQLYEFCAACHGDAGEGDQRYLAPAISGLPLWYVDETLKKFQAGGRGNHAEDAGGLRMRPMAMWLKSDEDVAAVSAYVAQLEPARPVPTLEGGDAERGAELYQPCIACHAANGDGNPQLKAPPIQYNSDWYLMSQLLKFKSGARGSNPADQFGALMRPMAMTLADDQAIKDVIAHVMSLADASE